VVPKKQRKVDQYMVKVESESLMAMISRMTAKDRLPFRVFTTSEDLRKLLASKGD